MQEQCLGIIVPVSHLEVTKVPIVKSSVVEVELMFSSLILVANPHQN